MEKEEKLQMTLTLIEAALKHGPALVQMIQDMSVENPTLADFEALRDRVPLPESYL